MPTKLLPVQAIGACMLGALLLGACDAVTPAPKPDAAAQAPADEATATPETTAIGLGRPGPSPTPAPAGPQAPDITSDAWLNSEALDAADLRGHPVLVEFWTFGCINCINTVPAMRALDAAYSARGLIIVGVHTPEFAREKDLEAVRAAAARLELRFPIALDNDMDIWRAFGNRAWPALHLIDKQGAIRKQHVGELHEGRPAWDEMTGLIETLLVE